MKKFITSILLTLGLSGYAMAEGDPQAGKDKALACGACHGPSGVSMSADFPHLAGQGERYLIKQIQDIKSGARSVPLMTGQTDNLSEQDIADIAAYFASQKAPAPGSVSAEQKALGEAIYRGGIAAKGVPACIACHAPTGQGNELAGFPVVAAQHQKYLAQQLVMFREGERTNDGDSKIMRAIAEKLSNKEIQAVSSYINALY